MKMKALSHYENDKETKYGDCILLTGNSLVVYDCGHERHAEEVKNYLKRLNVSEVHIVISHNDGDHTDGVLALMNHLKEAEYTVKVYTSLYLKSVNKIHKMLDDGRRRKNRTCEHILELFNHIQEIVDAAQDHGFTLVNAIPDTKVFEATIVGPTEDEFAGVVAKAIESDGKGSIDGETVMNAASIQLKCVLNDGKVLLLCGDASPEYLHELEEYDIIQLPHHGQLNDAEKVFEKLDNSDSDSYEKEYLISDNTGKGYNSGGSEDLVKMMKKNKYSLAHNTQNGVVELPKSESGNRRQGVVLGVMGCE